MLNLTIAPLPPCPTQFSELQFGNFPQNIWAVTEEGQPLEGQLENPQKGVYHGYPLPKSDPFSRVVLARWAKEDK